MNRFSPVFSDSALRVGVWVCGGVWSGSAQEQMNKCGQWPGEWLVQILCGTVIPYSESFGNSRHEIYMYI